MIHFDFEKAYQRSITEGGFREEKIQIPPEKKAYFVTKRITDLFFSLMGIFLSLLPSVVIALLIKATSKGPVFYLQDRLGQHGVPFKIIKFRTMKEEAEEETGPVWSEKDDPRVTMVGRVLRKTHLDELPQLINVLKGEMSLVGPRPERACFYQRFSEYIDGFEERLLVPRGLTGYAQISGGYDLKPEKKIIYDIQYMKSMNLPLDLYILARTAVNIVTRRFN